MNNRYPFVNGPLPYGYDALEPFIDEKTMQLHHDRHLQKYIDDLNALIEKEPMLKGMTLETMLRIWPRLPARLRIPVRNNAGGVYNHRFFFSGMKPDCGEDNGMSDNRLARALKKQFGSEKEFREQFKQAALSVFGSGYAWLVLENGRLAITTSANQNTPVTLGMIPILSIDVWEHAYYLKHYNVRAAYIDDWFSVIDRDAADRRFCAALRPNTHRG